MENKSNENRKQELLNIFLQGDIPICNCENYEDFNTEQCMLSEGSTEIFDFIEKYGEDPFEESTHIIVNYLINNIPKNKQYCDIYRADMYCIMLMNNGAKSLIGLVENCLTCDMECNGIDSDSEAVNTPNGKDFIDFIEQTYSIYLNDNNSFICFELKHNGRTFNDWYIISEDGNIRYRLYDNEGDKVID